MFERALALDARAIEAQIWLALMLINRVLDFVHGFFHYDAADFDLQRADDLGGVAHSAWAHYLRAKCCANEVTGNNTLGVATSVPLKIEASFPCHFIGRQ